MKMTFPRAMCHSFEEISRLPVFLSSCMHLILLSPQSLIVCMFLQHLNLRPSPLSTPVQRAPGLVLDHSACPCLHQALEGAIGHFSAPPKNCTLLSTESLSTHHPLSLALWLLFRPLFQRKTKRTHSLAVALHGDTFPGQNSIRNAWCSSTAVHVCSCHGDGKMDHFLHTSCWPRTLAPAPLRPPEEPPGPPCCSLGSSGFFWFRFFDFFISERFKHFFCESD